MKRTRVSSTSLLFILITAGCQVENESLEGVGTERPHELYAKLPAVYDLLNCQGYDMAATSLAGDHVLVERDIAIRLEALQSQLQGNPTPSNARTSQYVVTSGTIVSMANVADITFYIDPSVTGIHGDWTTAIRTAAQQWDDIPYCRVNFTEVFTAGAADLQIHADNSTALPDCMENIPGENNQAKAEYPGGGQSGRWISINNEDFCNTHACRETTMRHEFGHILGFRHNDYTNSVPGCDNPTESHSGTYAPDCPLNPYVSNHLTTTPTNDGLSVMGRCFDRNVDKLLSTYDKLAAVYLYPEGNPAVTVSSINQYYKTSTTRDIAINAYVNPIARMYRHRAERLPPWSETPVQSVEYITPSNTFWLNDVPLGTWRFRVTTSSYNNAVTIPGINTQVTVY